MGAKRAFNNIRAEWVENSSIKAIVYSTAYKVEWLETVPLMIIVKQKVNIKNASSMLENSSENKNVQKENEENNEINKYKSSC